jgi:2-polyprenyl-3-methyl-5-hydroxy-6-metoxy-1,4-benzoquinol methylase
VQARHEWWEDFFGGPWGELQAQGYPEARTHAETDFLVTALALVPGQQVLDLACGNGRHSIEMARRGMTVTGVDFNRNALATASRKAAENGVDVSFVEADMRAVEYEGTFDAAFSFFTSFGYFEDESDDLLVAQRIAAALKPGGRFVLETMSLETLLPVYQARRWEWTDEARTRRLLEETRVDFATSRIEADWVFLDGDSTRNAHSSLRLYCIRELSDLFRRAGFRETSALDARTGKPFTVGSRRLGLVASR